jgi:hypothetical protein
MTVKTREDDLYTCPICAGGSVTWTITCPVCDNKGKVDYDTRAWYADRSLPDIPSRVDIDGGQHVSHKDS